jgi:hypothetical protein
VILVPIFLSGKVSFSSYEKTNQRRALKFNFPNFSCKRRKGGEREREKGKGEKEREVRNGQREMGGREERKGEKKEEAETYGLHSSTCFTARYSFIFCTSLCSFFSCFSLRIDGVFDLFLQNS